MKGRDIMTTALPLHPLLAQELSAYTMWGVLLVLLAVISKLWGSVGKELLQNHWSAKNALSWANERLEKAQDEADRGASLLLHRGEIDNNTHDKIRRELGVLDECKRELARIDMMAPNGASLISDTTRRISMSGEKIKFLENRRQIIGYYLNKMWKISTTSAFYKEVENSLLEAPTEKVFWKVIESYDRQFRKEEINQKM